jgi:glycosyltransferase involved in cell wall biosynthesis
MGTFDADGGRPLITVIITSYNYAHYLRTSVGSVLRQDFPSFELVVVDNASTDDTDAVIAEFANDERLRYIKNPVNIGLTPNHNHGLRNARGDYVLFVSADDMLLPGHLRRCYDYLQAQPETDVLYTGAMFIDAAGVPTGIRAMGGQLPVDYNGGRNEFAQQLCEGCYIPYPSMLIRRSLYDELGPMDENFIAADYEITVRWAAAGKRFAYLRIPSCAIRLHGPQASGASYVSSGTDLSEYVAILEKYGVPPNFPQLRGYQPQIVGHLRWRAEFFRQTTGRELDPALAARVDAAAKTFESIPNGRVSDDLEGRPLISVIVRPGPLPLLIRSLSSLAQQVDAPPWEAIVVGEGGPDYSAILRTLPSSERIRFVRMDNVNPGEARHLGYRLAGGRIITYLEPGSAYEPTHLANVAGAFAAGAIVVRTNAVLVLADSQDGTANTITRELAINGIYRGEADGDRDLVAPAVPIDTVAHLRSALNAVGLIRTDLPQGETWEFWLRLRRLSPVTVPHPTVRVWMLRAASVPRGDLFERVIDAVYHAYPLASDSPLGLRRAAFARAMSEWQQIVPQLLDDQNAMVQFLAELHGIERPAAVAG